MSYTKPIIRSELRVFRQTADSYQTINIGNTLQLQFPHITTDALDEWSGVTYAYTPAESGDYLILISLEIEDNISGTAPMAEVQLRINGSTQLAAYGQRGGNSGIAAFNIHIAELAVVWNLTAGQPLTVYLQNTGSDSPAYFRNGTWIVRRIG